MKTKNVLIFLSITVLLFLPGCEIVAGIFKAGFWTAIILVILIVAVAMYSYKKLRK